MIFVRCNHFWANKVNFDLDAMAMWEEVGFQLLLTRETTLMLRNIIWKICLNLNMFQIRAIVIYVNLLHPTKTSHITSSYIYLSTTPIKVFQVLCRCLRNNIRFHKSILNVVTCFICQKGNIVIQALAARCQRIFVDVMALILIVIGSLRTILLYSLVQQLDLLLRLLCSICVRTFDLEEQYRYHIWQCCTQIFFSDS